MSNFIRKAFYDVCLNAKPAESHHVSLYIRVPFYGGPEEGGWWGEDIELIAFQEFRTESEAIAAAEAVMKLAEKMSKEAELEFSRQCQREMNWLDQRGLESDFLPEVNGPVKYWVCMEDVPGSSESRGCRHYE